MQRGFETTLTKVLPTDGSTLVHPPQTPGRDGLSRCVVHRHEFVPSHHWFRPQAGEVSTRIRLSVVTADGSTSDPVVVEAADGTTFAALRPGLALTYPATHAGCAISDDDVVGLPPLVDGALLEPPRRPESADAAPALVLVSVSGPRQGCSVGLTSGAVDLGRHHDLLGDDPLASRRHIRVTLTRGEVSVEDLASSNGVRRGSTRLAPHVAHPWRVGESIRVGASLLRLELATEPPDTATSTAAVPVPSLPEPMTFTWPQAPAPPRLAPLRWIAVLAPVPVAIVLAAVLHAAIMLCFMLVGPLVMVLTHVDDRRRGRRGGHSSAREHERAVRAECVRIAEALNAEAASLAALAPTPAHLEQIAAGARPGIGARRGPTARLIRLGHGDAPSSHHLTRDGVTHALGLTEAPATVVAEAASILHLEADDETAAGVLELVGAQLATLRDASDGAPVIVTREAGSARWAWAVESARVSVASTAPPSLLTALDDLSAHPGAGELPLVVLDAGAGGAARLARRLVTAGAAVIWVGSTPPPSVESNRVRVSPTMRVECARGHRAAHLPSGHRFTLDGPERTWFPTVMRLHRRWAGSSTHARGGLLRESHTDAILPTDVAEAWLTPTTTVPVGRDHDGVMTLDLARTGPHALVAGTTGSGKSEFLLTYLRGLFTLNSPTDVNALLIDYKGGATFGPLMRAPHVVGVVTDLDHGLAARALAALRAEITRREGLLGRHGFASFTEHLDATDAPFRLPRFFVVVDEFRVLAEELPDFVAGLVRLAAVGRSLGMHVVLATQRPGGAVTADMRANLDVRVALRVRERSDSIDVIDSPEASRIAASTPGRGFLVTAGEAPVEFQSAYCGAPRSLDDTTRAVHVHPTTAGPSGMIERRESCVACRPGATSSRTDLAMFVDEAVAAATGLPPIHRPVLPPLPENVEGLIVAATDSVDLRGLGDERPTLRRRVDETNTDTMPPPALPCSTRDSGDVVDDDVLNDTDDGVAPMGHRLADALADDDVARRDDHVIGVADLPAAQSQPVVTLPGGAHVGLAGAPRSGRTSAAWTLTAAARHGATLWWVGPDDPAHADVHVLPDDTDAVIALLTHLATPAAQERTCVVIDGWEELHATLLRINHGLAVDDLVRRVAEGHRHDHTFIVTGGRQVLASKLTALLDVRLVLRQNDMTEYSLAGLRPAQIPAAMPAGRALVLPNAHQVHLRRMPHVG